MTVEWEVAPEEAAQLAGRVRLANSQYLFMADTRFGKRQEGSR